ncbi:MAG: alpha/beta fold hydrolase [Burkholderiales bacterium]|nr:alpha/beta fold hydrolase [Burkholderiales bacterium]
MSSPRTPLRVIDTGIRAGRENMALDRALIEAHDAGQIPDTLRFLRFRPSALVGAHQILSHEVRLDYCRAKGIEVGRRITGGGALYLDERQFGWELVVDRTRFGTADLSRIAAILCEAAAEALQRLGVPAAYRPRNDIEVAGRKVSGTGGFVEGRTLLYQGTLLVDFDAAEMISALKVPVEKLAKRDLESAQKRVITLREVLGDALPPLEAIYASLVDTFAERLGFDPGWGAVTGEEEALAERIYAEEIGTDEYVGRLDAQEPDVSLVSATLNKRGGAIRADVRLEGPGLARVREVLVTGDFLRADGVRHGRTVARGFPRGDRGRARATHVRGGRQAAPRPPDRHACGQRADTRVPARRARLGAAMARHSRAARAGDGARRDRWGSGDSEALEPPFAHDYLRLEALEALPQVLDATGVREAILVGHSDGAAIALAFAGAHPERVRGVVSLAAHLFREAATLAEIREQIADFERGDLRARLARYHGAKTDILFRRLVELWTAEPHPGWGLEPLVAGVRCPVLAMHGAEDPYFSTAQLDAVQELVQGRFERVVLPRARHMPHLEARRAVLEAATRFIGELVGGTKAERSARQPSASTPSRAR